MGISVKKEAKYLGVWYNNNLCVDFSLKKLKPKEGFIFSKLYRLLKISDFRTRYNLWQIFIQPLYRMILSICGPRGSNRAKINSEKTRKKARTSSKRFCLCPKTAPVEIFDEMSKISINSTNRMHQQWESKAEEHTGYDRESQRDNYMNFSYLERQYVPIKKFHQNVVDVLSTVNKFHCSEH